MSERKWVVNASPVILLGKVGHLDLLEALCAQMIIPAAVVTEVCADPYQDAGQDWLKGHAQAYFQEVGTVDPLIRTWDLGAGETKVLTWARENPSYEAILDDRAARGWSNPKRLRRDSDPFQRPAVRSWPVSMPSAVPCPSRSSPDAMPDDVPLPR